LTDVAAAAGRLAEEAHHYSAPDYPVQYGPEIDALKRAAVLFKDHPYDAEAGGRLLDLASGVGRYLDTPPGAEELKERSTKVAELVQEMLGDLGIEDGKSLPSIVENVVVDTPYTEKAAGRLNIPFGKGRRVDLRNSRKAFERRSDCRRQKDARTIIRPSSERVRADRSLQDAE
jgi:hypothetical protein